MHSSPYHYISLLFSPLLLPSSFVPLSPSNITLSISSPSCLLPYPLSYWISLLSHKTKINPPPSSLSPFLSPFPSPLPLLSSSFFLSSLLTHSLFLTAVVWAVHTTACNYHACHCMACTMVCNYHACHCTGCTMVCIIVIVHIDEQENMMKDTIKFSDTLCKYLCSFLAYSTKEACL